MDAQEKLEWVGRQIALLKSGDKEGAQTNAKQVSAFFETPNEKTVLNFFIYEGGGESNGGGGPGQPPKPGEERPSELPGGTTEEYPGVGMFTLLDFGEDYGKALAILTANIPTPQLQRWENTFGSVKNKADKLVSSYGKRFWLVQLVGGGIDFLDDKLKKEMCSGLIKN